MSAFKVPLSPKMESPLSLLPLQYDSIVKGGSRVGGRKQQMEEGKGEGDGVSIIEVHFICV
jgi:hypothetical protein